MSKYCAGMSQLPAAAVVSAATQLLLAGQWAAATDLLNAATPDHAAGAAGAADPAMLAEHAMLALARAEVAVDRDFGQQTDHATAALAAADGLLNGSAGGALVDGSAVGAVPGGLWDLALLRFRRDYSTALFQGGDRELRDRARVLIEQAPDDARRGAANFWAGAMTDNLYEQPAEACAHYRIALELGERCGDELLMGQALRHLGYHAHAAGDLVLARAQWERSTELLQKAGHLRPALAQQAYLALLLRDEGDRAGSQALATEVNRWARQLGIPFITHQTAELMEPA
jgi:hypothetical protein